MLWETLESRRMLSVSVEEPPEIAGYLLTNPDGTTQSLTVDEAQALPFFSDPSLLPEGSSLTLIYGKAPVEHEEVIDEEPVDEEEPEDEEVPADEEETEEEVPPTEEEALPEDSEEGEGIETGPCERIYWRCIWWVGRTLTFSSENAEGNEGGTLTIKLCSETDGHRHICLCSRDTIGICGDSCGQGEENEEAEADGGDGGHFIFRGCLYRHYTYTVNYIDPAADPRPLILERLIPLDVQAEQESQVEEEAASPTPPPTANNPFTDADEEDEEDEEEFSEEDAELIEA